MNPSGERGSPLSNAFVQQSRVAPPEDQNQETDGKKERDGFPK